MIERVARLLCVVEGDDPDELEPGNSVDGWEGEDVTLPNGDPAHFRWRHKVRTARLVIEVMREPTDAMNEAGHWHAGSEASACFTAMIDAALKEQPA